MAMDNPTVEVEDAACSILELAANDDLEGFKKWVEKDPSSIDEAGTWYVRALAAKQIVLDERTPLMVAATYGSIHVLNYIVSFPDGNVNQGYGLNKTTALHCAASSGSRNAIDIIQLLIAAGANPEISDENGHRPRDVLVVSQNFKEQKSALEKLLSAASPAPAGAESVASSSSSSSKKKEYPAVPNLPDISNSIYATDEFRMFGFKIQPCSRNYSHDWTGCPFVHPGENARRRDPRRYRYSSTPCPEFRKGECRKGDSCEKAHGLFEIWLHPAQYRTRMCKDRTNCTRKVCFFAHQQSELRPVSSPPSPTQAVEYGAPFYYPGSPPEMVLRQAMPHHWVQPPAAPPPMLGTFIPPPRLRPHPLVIARNAMNMVPSNLDGMFAVESSSPQSGVYVNQNHFQQMQQQGILMSPRIMAPISPSTSRVSMAAPVHQFGSVSSQDLGSASSSSSATQVDWTINPEIDRLGMEDDEPDVSWVQSLVADSPQDAHAHESASFHQSLAARFGGMHINGYRYW